MRPGRMESLDKTSVVSWRSCQGSSCRKAGAKKARARDVVRSTVAR